MSRSVKRNATGFRQAEVRAHRPASRQVYLRGELHLLTTVESGLDSRAEIREECAESVVHGIAAAAKRAASPR